MEEFENRILHGDIFEWLEQIKSNSIDLAVTSPPYNIGKEYEKKTPIEDYIKWSEDYFKEVYRVLKSDRSFMLQVGQHVDKLTNNIPLTYLLFQSAINAGFKVRQEIIWYFKGGMQAKKKLTGQNEKIMWLYKGDKLPYFDVDSVRVKEWQAIDKRNNPNEKNPTDVWEFNRVAGNSKEKLGHPCQFPVVMIERIVKGWSKEGETVLDCFMGSGTTAEACINTNRNFIGIERDWNYCDMANERVKQAKLQNQIKE